MWIIKYLKKNKGLHGENLFLIGSYDSGQQLFLNLVT